MKNFNLSLYANKFGPEGGINVSKNIDQLVNLESFSLDLFFANITTTGTEVLSKNLSKLTQLKSLKLNLEFNYIEEEGGKLLGDALSNLTGLETLSLNVATKNFGPSGFHYVTQGLLKLTKVTDLTILCGVNRVAVQGVQDLKTVIGSMPNLKKFKLDFVENYIGEGGAQPFVDMLQGLRNVEDLDISLNFNDLKDWGAETVTKGVANMS